MRSDVAAMNYHERYCESEKNRFASAIEARSRKVFLRFIHSPSVRRPVADEVVATLVSEEVVRQQLTNLRKIDVFLEAVQWLHVLEAGSEAADSLTSPRGATPRCSENVPRAASADGTTSGGTAARMEPSGAPDARCDTTCARAPIDEEEDHSGGGEVPWPPSPGAGAEALTGRPSDFPEARTVAGELANPKRGAPPLAPLGATVCDRDIGVSRGHSRIAGVAASGCGVGSSRANSDAGGSLDETSPSAQPLLRPRREPESQLPPANAAASQTEEGSGGRRFIGWLPCAFAFWRRGGTVRDAAIGIHRSSSATMFASSLPPQMSTRVITDGMTRAGAVSIVKDIFNSLPLRPRIRDTLIWFRVLILTRTFAILLLREIAALHGYLTWCQCYWSWAELHGVQSTIHAALSSWSWWREWYRSGWAAMYNRHRSTVLSRKAALKVLIHVVVDSLGAVSAALDRMNTTLSSLHGTAEFEDELVEELIGLQRAHQASLKPAVSPTAARVEKRLPPQRAPTSTGNQGGYRGADIEQTTSASNSSMCCFHSTKQSPTSPPSLGHKNGVSRVAPNLVISIPTCDLARSTVGGNCFCGDYQQSPEKRSFSQQASLSTRPPRSMLQHTEGGVGSADGCDDDKCLHDEVFNPLAEVSAVSLLTINGIANMLQRSVIHLSGEEDEQLPDELNVLCNVSSPRVARATPWPQKKGRRHASAAKACQRELRSDEQWGVPYPPRGQDPECSETTPLSAHDFLNSGDEGIQTVTAEARQPALQMNALTNLREVPLCEGVAQLHHTVRTARRWLSAWGSFAQQTQAPPKGWMWMRAVVAVTAVVAPVAWLSSHSLKQLKSYVTVTKGFCSRFGRDYVEFPVKAVYATLFTQRAGVEARKRAWESEIVSLAKIIRDYHADYLMDPPEAYLNGIQSRAEDCLRAGVVDQAGYGLISLHYEAAIRHPIRSALFGNLLRLMLIQLTHQQLEVSRVVNGMDDVLDGNDLNFKIMALVPCVGLVAMTSLLLWRHYCAKVRPVHQRMRSYWRTVHRVVTYAERGDDFSFGGGAESGQLGDLAAARRWTGLGHGSTSLEWGDQSMGRGHGGEPTGGPGARNEIVSVTHLQNYDQGLVLLLVHHMRSLALEYLSHYCFLSEFLEDLDDLESVRATRHQRLLTLERMLNTHYFLQV